MMNLRKNRIWKILLIAALDAICLFCSGAAALWVRFDFSFDAIPRDYIQLWLEFLPIQIVVTLVLFLVLKMYNYIWHSVGFRDVVAMGLVVLAAFLINLCAGIAAHHRLPFGMYFIMLLCEEAGMVGMRCFFRFRMILWGPAEPRRSPKGTYYDYRRRRGG